MTIDEAIMAHKKEADECRNLILKEKQLEPQESYYCLCLEKNAKEHEQLAEWLEELKQYKEAGEQGVFVKIKCHCKDCKHWKDEFVGCTDHVKLCGIGRYMVGENGYCLYAEQALKESEG